MNVRATSFLVMLSIGFNFGYFLWWNWLVTDKTVWFVVSGILRNFPSSILFILPFLMLAIFHIISGITLFNSAKIGAPITILLLASIFSVDLLFAKFLFKVEGISETSILVGRAIMDGLFVFSVTLFLSKSAGAGKATIQNK